MGNIARIFKVSTVAVLKWVRAAAAQVEPQQAKNIAEIVMIDEFWHFVNGKKTKHGYGEPLMGYRVDLLDGSWAIVAIPVLKNSLPALTQELAHL